MARTAKQDKVRELQRTLYRVAKADPGRRFHALYKHARDRVREITARERLLVPSEEIVQDLNGYLRGWAGYFR